MKTLKKIIKYAIIVFLFSGILVTIFLIKASFKGKVEHISFKSDIELNGVLIKPETPGPHPIILLLHGSGDSHQEYGKLYFKLHANAFVKNGFAVMIYSKREFLNNNLDYKYFTYQDLLKDAQAAINYLKQRKDIDSKTIGVMGASESGWFTPELAYNNTNIKFIINEVSSPFSVFETISHEVQQDALAEGFTVDEIKKEILPLTKRTWQFYIDVYKGNISPNGAERKAINNKKKSLVNHDRFGKWFVSPKLKEYDSLLYASRAKRFLYNPMPYYNRLNIPMLYIMAGKDKNIPTKRVVDFLKQSKANDNKDITIKVYPEASHYLYKYGLEDGPYQGWLYYEDYLDTMTNWAKSKVN